MQSLLHSKYMILVLMMIWTILQWGPIPDSLAADRLIGYQEPGRTAWEGLNHRGDPRIYNRGSATRNPYGWTVRVMTRQELERLGEKDWDLSPSYAKRLLARLNARDFDYIDEDIRSGRPIRVPNDFSAFKTWTPLPRYLPELALVPKFVLIAKDIPFIGWYERGRLIGDTYICVGKQDQSTAAGIYTVLEKDRDHVSRSYPNAYGEPAPMPWALRIYELVWIHAGDIVGARCSHGCINLPIEPAVKLFEWASQGTPVMIVNALRDVPTVIARNRSNCSIFASTCAIPAAKRGRS